MTTKEKKEVDKSGIGALHDFLGGHNASIVEAKESKEKNLLECLI